MNENACSHPSDPSESSLRRSILGEIAGRFLVHLFEDGAEIFVGDLEVRVFPGASKELLGGVHDGVLDARRLGHLAGQRHVLVGVFQGEVRSVVSDHHLGSLEVEHRALDGPLADDLDHLGRVQSHPLREGEPFAESGEHRPHQRVDDELGPRSVSHRGLEEVAGLSHRLQTAVLDLVEEGVGTRAEKDEGSLVGGALGSAHGGLQKPTPLSANGLVHPNHVGFRQGRAVDDRLAVTDAGENAVRTLEDDIAGLRRRQHRVGDAGFDHHFSRRVLDDDGLVGEPLLQGLALGSGAIPNDQGRGLGSGDSLRQQPRGHALSHDSQADESDRRRRHLESKSERFRFVSSERRFRASIERDW
mmetsp:Transcript_9141/g.22405  ORF Transcript_9141/g.22405 Transcript_9141/m.22405 type:complete len:359 (+) Transcript_9141:154-1230(+)